MAWQARSVRGEGGDSGRCPEPSAGLIGEGRERRGLTRAGVLLWGDEWEHPCDELVDAGGFCGGGGVDGEVGAVGFFEA